MKASVMLEHEVKYAVILAFDVRIERDAQDMADSLGVKIFQVRILGLSLSGILDFLSRCQIGRCFKSVVLSLFGLKKSSTDPLSVNYYYFWTPQ